jgi:hypothetical protein
MLTARLERYVRATFAELEVDAVLTSLRRWRISSEGAPPSERLLAAVVFMAEGRTEGLEAGFRLGELDWRDLLVAGEVANEGWPDVVDARLGDR